MIKELNTLSHFIKYDLMDEFSKSVELTDLESIGIALLNTHDDSIEEIGIKDILHEYISILNFIENETSIPTSVSDDIYDQIVEQKARELLGKIQISKIVEEKIQAMEIMELEELVMSVMKQELQAVINLGALIGAVIGAINLFI